MSDDTIRLFGGRGSRDFPPDSDQTNGGAPGIVGRITTATASIGVDKFFMIQPQVLTGGECEGCTGTFTDLPTASIPVYNLGPGSYVQGDKVLARFVRSRYVSGRGAGSGGGCSSGTVGMQTIGCSSQPIPSASVTITGPSGSGFSSSGTTDSGGFYNVSLVGLPNGTYTGSATKARFNSGSGSTTIATCTSGTGVITMTPATGYYCDPCTSWQAIPGTLTFTTSYGMTITLTQTGTVSGYPFYEGTTTFAGRDYTLTFTFNGSTCAMNLSYLGGPFGSIEIIPGTVTASPYSVYFTGLTSPGGTPGDSTATITE